MGVDSPIPQASILIVDDEPAARSALVKALGIMGYRVAEAHSGEDALGKLAESEYDLMLLDLRLPDIDGTEVMRRVQEAHPDLPVIVFTGHASLESAIEAVRAGAVDYLVKPCSLREIQVAISRALWQRLGHLRWQGLVSVLAEALEDLRVEYEGVYGGTIERPAHILQCGSVTLDTEKRLVLVRGGELGSAELTSGEASLLAQFMRNPETVLSCRELAREALGYDVTEREAQEIVRPHISRLRKKIEPDPANPRIIRTVRGKGYLFSCADLRPPELSSDRRDTRA